MLRRKLFGWLGLAGGAAAVAIAPRAREAFAPKQEGPLWFCYLCKTSGLAATKDEARTAYAVHCATEEHWTRAEMSERVRALKGQIKRKRRGEKIESGYAKWADKNGVT
jgi:hypothetical protein